MSSSAKGITWKIGGEAGFGIMSTGEMFARIGMRAGLNVFSYPEYPSLVRGGHNTVQVTVSPGPVTGHSSRVEILLALNRETFDFHIREVAKHGVIIYDSSDRAFKGLNPASVGRSDVRLIGLPLEKLAVDNGGQVLMRNTVALGVSCALLGIPSRNLTEVIDETFGKKGDKVVTLNSAVLMAGYKAVTPAQKKQCPWSVTSVKRTKEQVLLTGNDAIALGAIQAGCQFFSAYPMTPASSILHVLAKHGPDFGIVVRHAEDEIGAVHHAIGAAYAGVRAMTATSGGGFALMTEAVGLAAMAEVGIVIVNAQRPGPSTGLPTWQEQGDLRQVLHASQGDFPRIVLAPGSHAECFTLIQEAFNLAERYQNPVIVLTDKYFAEGLRNVAIADLKILSIDRGKIWMSARGNKSKKYLRYQAKAADGIAPRSLPGTPGGLFLANSDEHDEYGYSNEQAQNRIAQMERRARKITTLKKSVIRPRLVGSKGASLTVVTWGSSAGPVEATLRILEKKNKLKANALIITMIAPFPAQAVMAALKAARHSAIVEGNQSGALASIIRQETGFVFDQAINRYDGRPFDPAELADQLTRLIKK